MKKSDRERIGFLGFLSCILLYSNAALFFIVAGAEDQTVLKSFFFAIQTITTTGYGSGFKCTDDIMRLGCFFMLCGATAWGVLIGIAANALRD